MTAQNTLFSLNLCDCTHEVIYSYLFVYKRDMKRVSLLRVYFYVCNLSDCVFGSTGLENMGDLQFITTSENVMCKRRQSSFR